METFALDAAFGRATASCAETLSGIAELDPTLRERAHLQPQFRQALRAELGHSVLVKEVTIPLSNWDGNPAKGGPGGVDVVVVQAESSWAALAELKWVGDWETFAWCVFDALKMASARRSDLAMRCYVVAGAPRAIWKASTSSGTMLIDGEHDVASVVERYDGKGAVFSEAVAWPTALPARIETTVAADAPVTTAQAPWKLKCVRIEPLGSEALPC